VNNTDQLETKFVQSAEKPAYAGSLALLLLTWVAMNATSAILLAALFFPGHLGLSDLLRAIGELLPIDPVGYTT
jgi:hypothetical protein